MAPFPCPNCGRLNHFEVRVCPQCGFTLGYDPTGDRFLFLGDDATTWRDRNGDADDLVVCANNNDFQICNWLVRRDDPIGYCLSCRHNRTIPDLTGPTVPERWAKIEEAKRRMLHTVLRLGLPLETKQEEPERGLAFDFLYDPQGEASGTVQITTGHEAGLITLNLIEADDVAREAMRRRLGEPYRTLLGHFRHEVGHHYWARLIEHDSAELPRCRALFGDDTMSYEEAKDKHYGGDGGPLPAEFISAYATMHPWEDFAETFAHLFHIIDSLATIHGLGLTVDGWPGREPAPHIDFDPYDADTDRLVTAWRPFSFMGNAIDRAMGMPDLYPFHLTEGVVEKLDYVNALLRRSRA